MADACANPEKLHPGGRPRLSKQENDPRGNSPQDRSYKTKQTFSNLFPSEIFEKIFFIDKIRREYFDKGDQGKVIGSF